MIQPPRLSLLAAAAALLLGASAATAQELIRPLSVAGWEGGAYRRDDGRVLCAVWDQYAEGVGLWLGWDETGFYIDVVDPRLGLKPDHVYGATLQIDDRWRAEAEGYAIAADTIAITFGKDEAAISAFRGGKELYLPEIDRSYTLHGTKDAIAELLRCYRSLQ